MLSCFAVVLVATTTKIRYWLSSPTCHLTSPFSTRKERYNSCVSETEVSNVSGDKITDAFVLCSRLFLESCLYLQSRFFSHSLLLSVALTIQFSLAICKSRFQIEHRAHVKNPVAQRKTLKEARIGVKPPASYVLSPGTPTVNGGGTGK